MNRVGNEELLRLYVHSHSASNYSMVFLFRSDDLELLGAVCEVVGVCLGHKLPLVRLLHKVFVALLVRKVDGVLLRLELYPVAIHEVCRRLPSHQLVLPPVSLGQDVPVHQPVV